jgi:hypothetical protein
VLTIVSLMIVIGAAGELQTPPLAEDCSMKTQSPLEGRGIAAEAPSQGRGAAAEEVMASGTLPVIYITTKDSVPITSKEYYIDATYYVDPMGVEGYDSLGSAEAQLPLQIRGRGNYTWLSFDKKPYRLKLGEKQHLLGMNKSKHFALLAHADDNVGYTRNTAGFELSRRMGMPFTPAQEPVEVVLNGEYIGLYFLTETIRVSKNRVNIKEQENGETDPDSISGGWLVEIDNNPDSNQILFDVSGTNLSRMRVTYHSPDSLSTEQHDYLYNQIESILQAFYSPGADSTLWEKLIDKHSLAQYYVINEVLDHLEAFIGSCYMYKDFGEEKWKFGPVWDLGHAFNSIHSKRTFIYQNNPFPTSIINQIAKFPSFQEEVRRVWNDFYPAKYEGMQEYLNQFLKQIAEAVACNHKRWPAYRYSYGSFALSRLKDKVAWLDTQWGEASGIECPSVDGSESSSKVYDIGGRRVSSALVKNGVYIVKRSGKATKYIHQAGH